MKLGYSYRLSQYAFGMGMLALVLASGIVFFLNLVTLRAERYQTQFSSRLSHANQNEGETEGVAPPVPSPSPEFSAPPEMRQLPRIAARETVLMMRPMAFYLVLTGGALVLLRGSRPRAIG